MIANDNMQKYIILFIIDATAYSFLMIFFSPYYSTNSLSFFYALCSRFIINIKKEDREDVVRLCFQAEQAYWFYLDFFCPESPNNPAVNMTGFTRINIPILIRNMLNLFYN